MEQLEIIVFNEYRNISSIHLYYSEDTDRWKAFGLSAYILTRVITDLNMPYSADYSFSAMMPSVILSNSGVDRIKSACAFTGDHTRNHIVIPVEITFDKNDYIAWAQSLRNQQARSNENKA